MSCFCHRSLQLIACFLLCLSWAGRTFADSVLVNSDSPPASLVELYNDPTNGLGSWIWESQVSDNQTCQLWRAFNISSHSPVQNARLSMTVDNEFTLYLDGRELGHGVEWHELYVFDITTLLPPGRHIIAVKAFNSYTYAGMLLGLSVDYADGSHFSLRSDADWRIVPLGTRHWEKKTVASLDWPSAVVEAPVGGPPWWTRPLNIDVMPTLQPIRLYFWQTVWFQVLVLTTWLLAVITTFWLVAKLTLHRKEQWLLQRERSRIARDIHDDLGSRITQLVLHGEVAQSELPPEAELRSQIDLICQDAREVLSVLDEVLWAVNPRRDLLRDFSDYISDYALHYLKFTSVQCLLDIAPDIPQQELNLPLRRGLLMVIKEALNNVVKHSNATELRLQIRCEHGRVKVILQDNGKGFDPQTIQTKRSGLYNMNQRLAELGGDCLITSQPGQGCRIELTVPLKQPRWKFWRGSDSDPTPPLPIK